MLHDKTSNFVTKEYLLRIHLFFFNINALAQPMISQTEINGCSPRHKYFFKTHCRSFSLLSNFESSSSVIWPGMRRFWNMMILAVEYMHTSMVYPEEF